MCGQLSDMIVLGGKMSLAGSKNKNTSILIPRCIILSYLFQIQFLKISSLLLVSFCSIIRKWLSLTYFIRYEHEIN